jgi:shikimate kinase
LDKYDDNNKLYYKEATNMDVKNYKIILNIIENLPIKKNKVSNKNDKRRAKKRKNSKSENSNLFNERKTSFKKVKKYVYPKD